MGGVSFVHLLDGSKGRGGLAKNDAANYLQDKGNSRKVNDIESREKSYADHRGRDIEFWLETVS